MGDFRIRDAERSRYLTLVEEAAASGRLGEADRDLRVARIREAESREELDALTRDLPAWTPAPRQAPVEASLSDPPARRPLGRTAPSGRVLAGGLIALAGLLGLGIASTVLATFTGSADQSSQDEATASPYAEPIDARTGGERFAMTPGKVRAFVRSYEREFGTRESYSAVLTGARVIVEVPVRGPRPRYARWLYDGSWRRLATTTAVLSPAEIVDLDALDVPRMFANIAKAERTLGVENGTMTHVVVHRWNDEVATVNIYVANMFDESGHVATTLAGDRVVRRFPFTS